ncbi:MAG: hypothetical protein ABIR79_25640 [Candidatus Binatia bacterium]
MAGAVEGRAAEEQDPRWLLGRDRDGVAGRDVDRALGVVGGERQPRAGREGRIGVEGR